MTQHQHLPYRGRFAPSPTGPLHFGSLVCALASYLDAKYHKGRWLVRMEDLDKDREQPGAARQILSTLETLGFKWDEEIVYQSHRTPLYDLALDELRSHQHIYPCACSRKDIQSFLDGKNTSRYPGICRQGIRGNRSARSLRLKTEDESIGFIDQLQGPYSQSINKTVGDFVLKRADGFYAYQLAVVVDDAEQAISHIVRGSDLLDNTPRQILLQRLLGLSTPTYLHHPVAVSAKGEKLSKQTFAEPVDVTNGVSALSQAWHFLGQTDMSDLNIDNLHDFWTFAVRHWDSTTMPKKLSIAADKA